MSTGSIQSPSKTLFKYQASGILLQTFTASADIKEGLPVKISGSGTVAPAVPTEQSIGVAKLSVLNGEQVTVAVTAYVIDELVQITGGAATAGNQIAFTGSVNADGIPTVTVATSGDYVKAIAITSGIANSEIRVGVLSTQILLP